MCGLKKPKNGRETRDVGAIVGECGRCDETEFAHPDGGGVGITGVVQQSEHGVYDQIGTASFTGGIVHVGHQNRMVV